MERSDIRILVVDDEDEVRTIISKALSQAGFTVESAASGQEARQSAGQHPYHLLLVDLILPDESGLQVIDAIRAGENPPPVIIITGQPSVDTATEGMHLGVRNYLTKPISPTELIRSVESLLASEGLLIDSEEQFLVELGRRLKAERQKAELTMRALGARINISQAQISQIEAGLSAPSLTTLFRLARALRVRMSDLMRGF